MLLSEDGKIWLAVCTVSLSAFSDAGHMEMRKKGCPYVWKYCPESHRWKRGEDMQLTEREHSILALSAQGYTIKDISEQLYIAEVTVKFHRNRLFEKLRVNNITKALSMAINCKKL
jgi:DNA-binding NarL/FixJ family response regulator